jgi:GT2 family glycosyltransferase
MPNQNNGRVLDRVLDRLAQNTTYDNFELVVVDDGSSDDSRATLRRWRDSKRFASFELREQEQSGAIAALNAGLDAASGEIVVQLDADASVETSGWLERLLELLLFDERVGVVTAKVVLDDGGLHACGVNLVGPGGFHDRPTRITERAGRRTWHQRVDRPAEGTTAEEGRLAEVDSGIGCCMAYRREDALAIGGYDRGFDPVWFDDLDLCMSIRRLGKKAFFCPDVHVLHLVRTRAGLPLGPDGLSDRARLGLRGAAGKVGSISPSARAAVARRLGLNQPPPEHRDRLRHHYGYWQEKWGWDMLNPDMDAVHRRHGDTEVCWASDPERRAAGEQLLAGFASVAGTAAP